MNSTFEQIADKWPLVIEQSDGHGMTAPHQANCKRNKLTLCTAAAKGTLEK